MGKTKRKKKIRNKQDKKTTIKKNLNRDILGAIIFTLGLLSILSLFSSKMGIIGSIINRTSFSLFGFGAYLFPLSLFFLASIFIMDKLYILKNRIITYSSILFLSILIVLDGASPIDLAFLERASHSLQLSQLGKGGGLVGSIFGFFFYKLFGSIGAYIVLGVIIFISILLIVNIKLKDLINKIDSKIKNRSKKDKPIINNKLESEKEFKEKEIEVINYKKNKRKTSSPSLNMGDELIEDNLLKVEEMNEEVISNKSQTSLSNYTIPSLLSLRSPSANSDLDNEKEMLKNAEIIQDTMKNFGIDAKILEINVGPTITCYELQPSPGIKLSRIVSLSDNIALSLASSDIRIEAPIPGKSAVGIEVPNKVKKDVLFKELVISDEYKSMDSNIPLALGKNVSGNIIVSSIDKMPHLLIAGATGSGKSVCINTIIMSILYKSSPDDVKLLLIDPKMVELSIYNGIPHLLIPVVTEAKKAASALNWAVAEMEKRYKIFADNNVRDIHSYNNKVENKETKLPSIVIIIDELADLMMVAAQEIEDYICRLAQMARAAGIYIIVATQRPSVDVITGTIKANIPSRISFAVSSQVDSRTILDMAGAEKLLGKGDMLFYPSFYSKPLRVQGAFISDQEVENVVNSLKEQEITEYNEEIIEVIQNPKDLLFDDSDELLPQAIELVVNEGQASISLLQRRLKIGYARAARLVDEMEDKGIIGGYEGSKPRKVLVSKEDLNLNTEQI